MTHTRRDVLTRSLAGVAALALPAAVAASPESPYGLESFDYDPETGNTPDALWEAKVIVVGRARALGGEIHRSAWITGYEDGSGRIAFWKVGDRENGYHDDLFDDLSFAAARIDPDTFRAFWLGLGASSIDQPMTAEAVAEIRSNHPV